MWRPLILTATSIVAVPYAVALLANILYGWPLGPRRYRRALHPQKVLAVNYAILLEFLKVKYLCLAFRWRHFYLNAPKDVLIKDLSYGSSGNCLDVYLPSTTTSSLHPVVVFIYGGTWGSGDKNMYGLLCAELANSLSCIVLCPNYSTYPKGFVDDMVQDLSDVIAFIHQRAFDFQGDKDRVVLVGHSAGAHLAMMTVLELMLKRLDGESTTFTEQKLRNDETFSVSYVQGMGDIVEPTMVNFGLEDEGSSDNLGRFSSESVADLPTVESHLITDQQANEAVNVADETCQITDAVEEAVTESFYVIDNGQNADTDVTCSQAEDCQKTKPSELVNSGILVEKPLSEEPLNSGSQPDKQQKDLLSTVRLVVGLAGVYDIKDHFDYETFRGVEDISTMARAMYGPKQFDRFSPTKIVRTLPPGSRLPAIHLIHGDIDRTVPESQSRLFGQAVCERTVGRISESVLVGCGHTDICLDLMDRRRQWHHIVKADIRRVFCLLVNS